VKLVARPNFRALGPRFQARSEVAARAIRELGQDGLRAFRRGDAVTIDVAGEAVQLDPAWLEVVEAASGDLVVKAHEGHAAALDPSLDDELRQEGMARELVNRIQRLRKESGLEITDRIHLGIEGPSEVREALARFEELVARETLALDVAGGADGTADGFDAVLEDDIDGCRVRVALSRVR
jgi:isoleucyl-tRNA synthetase